MGKPWTASSLVGLPQRHSRGASAVMSEWSASVQVAVDRLCLLTGTPLGVAAAILWGPRRNFRLGADLAVGPTSLARGGDR